MSLQVINLAVIAGLVLLLCLYTRNATAQDVLTHHYSNDRLGVQSLETLLTPSNVNSEQFGKLFSFPVLGDVYAQPLFIKQYTMNDGKAHNVLFVATQEDYVYAFDADGKNPSQGYLWRVSLLGADETYLSKNDVGTDDTTPNIGITGTPVIDRTQGALYVLAKSKTTGGSTQFIQRLHALKLSDGTEILNGPTTIAATVNGTGDGGNTVSFNSLTQNQRPALLLASTPNGTSKSTVFIGWASHGDNGVYHGWIIGYNAADISKQVGVWNDTPNGSDGGIWMSAGGIAADGNGNLFAVDGNGTFDADSGGADFGDSAFRLTLSGSTLAEKDYFTPADQGSINSEDADMGTGGIILLPDQSGSTPHLAVTIAKLGNIYLLNRDNLGKYNGSSPTALQSFDTGGYSVHNTPAFFNNTLYLGVDGGPIEAWPLNSSTALFNTTPRSTSGNIFGCYHCNGSGSTVSISANGMANGIVWALDNSGYGNSSAVLYAYDAANLSELYDSNQTGNGRDSAAVAVKFTTPTIANGHVYVGGRDAVTVYGVLGSAPPTVATPTFSPAPGTYTSPQIVTISDSQKGATLYYTTDGSTPSTSSKVYSGPIQVSTSTTVKALATATGYQNSPVTTATYIIGGSQAQQVQIPLAQYANTYGIYTDGTSFDTGGLDGAGYAYSANLLGASLTYSGILYDFGTPNQKNVVRGINAPVIDLTSGHYYSLNLLATSVNGNQTVQTFTVTYTDGTKSTFTQDLSSWLFSEYFIGESIASTMAYRNKMDGGRDGIFTYWLYQYSFALDQAKTVKSLTMPDNSNVALLAITLAANPVTSTTPAPTFSPAEGTYTAPQVVTLSDSQSGAIIYYTTDGSTPSSSSKVYSGPIQVSVSTTLNAMATAVGYYDSPVATATYTISPPATQQFQVPLDQYANTYGIYLDGSKFSTGGLDGAGYAYSANLLGDSLTYSRITYAFGAPNQQNVVRGINAPVIGLPSGSYAFLNLLATSIKGNQTSQTFTVTYTDGASSTFTRDISDWVHPQNFIGESIASTMSYGDYMDGGQDSTRSYSLYQYSFALDPTKTVKSLTMPDNGNVALLAITLASNPVTSTTPAPTFSPAPGTYTSPQAVTISDSHSGANIYYTTDGSTPSTFSKVYSGPIQVSATTTIKAIAVATAYENSPVATAIYTISPSAPQQIQIQVPLAQYADTYGIYWDGSKFSTGGLDGAGYAYSANLLGNPLTYSGITYTFGTPNQQNVVSGLNAPVIELPNGSYASLNFLATGVNGYQASQTFTVTYTDGTSSIFTQDLSDLGSPQNYTGESTALSMAYRDDMDGKKEGGSYNLYQYSFTLDQAKTVKSLTVPHNGGVALLAITLVANLVPVTPAPTFSPTPGTYAAPLTVTISDTQSGVAIYYTTDGSTPSTSSKVYSGPIQVSTSTTVKALATAAGYQNSPVTTATYIIGGSRSQQVQVPLTQYANTYGIYTDGTSFDTGGLDGAGYAYSANLLGTSLTRSGILYVFGTPNQKNVVRGINAPVIDLASGHYSFLNLLGTAVNGNQSAQSFTVTYTDGTTSTFTQDLSDWTYPANFVGESVASVMDYRDYKDGGTDSYVQWYLYQYSFALDPTKTVKSLTLPNNSDVALLAITLVVNPVTTTTPAPTFSPTAGMYTAPQVVTLSDSQSGAIIYYTTDGSTPSSSSKVYSGPIQVSVSTTLKAMATTVGYYDSPVTTATYTISPPTTQQFQVPLAQYANTYGIYLDGTQFSTGGLDSNGYTYSANLLGDSLTYSKITYAFGAPNQKNVVRGINAPVIGLPTGSYAFLNLLATSIKGSQTSQTFTVKYTDGTSSTFTRDLSDWFAPQNFIGESTAASMFYCDYMDGGVDSARRPFLYQYSVALDLTKTVKSLTMPDNGNIALLAITLASTPVTSKTPTPTFDPTSGTYTAPQAVTLSDSHSGAKFYYTTDGSTPSTASKVYTGPIQVSDTTTLKAIATATGYENSSVATATYIIAPPASQQVQVSLAQNANTYGIYEDGSKFTTGGLDSGGYAYSANQMGTSLSYLGIIYTFGTPNQQNVVRGINAPVIGLPSGTYSSLKFLAIGVNGNQRTQTFTVTYTDGTSSILTQDLSDWESQDGFPGQSVALSMSYRNYMDGTKGNAGCTLDQYTFALDPKKTVKSFTMPNNRNVALLAITLVENTTTSKTPTPTFSPAPGTYTAPQTVTISDSQSGATIYYTTDGSTPTTTSKIYSEPIRISASTTIKAMATSAGHENSLVSTANYKINLQWAAPEFQVPLAQYANTYGFYTDGTTFSSGGLDGAGDAYSANLLGSSFTHSGVTYKFGTPNQQNSIRGVNAPIIGLKIGRYSSLNLLGTAVNGNQPSQTFVVTYTDGTTSKFEQGISDWYTPQNYAGESIAKAMPYRNYSFGEKDNQTFNLYQYSFALDPTKTVKSLTMPDNSDVAILAITLVSSQTRISLSAFANAAGIYTDSTQFSSGGINGHNEAFSSNLLGDLLTYEGVTYGFEIANQKNVVRGQIAYAIPIPSRRYTSLNFLAIGVIGNQPWQAFTVTYTDGTKSSFLQSVSNWHQTQHYRGESVALQMTYFDTGDGGRDPKPANVYAYSFPLNSKKTVKSLTIPQNHNVVLLAVTLE